MNTNEEIILKAKAFARSMIERSEAYYRSQGIKLPSPIVGKFGPNGYQYYVKMLRILEGEPPLCKNCRKPKKDHDELGGVRICSTVTYVAEDDA